MKKRVYLWETILNKLISLGVKSYEIDIRYLQRWVNLYPFCFPKCVISDSFTAVFNPKKYRWEIWSGKHGIKFEEI